MEQTQGALLLNDWERNEANKESSVQSLRKVEPYLTALEVNGDDKLLLGASNLSGNTWSGSLWLFKNPENAPIASKNIAGMEVESGASDAKFYDDNRVIYSDYSGVVAMLSIESAASDCPVYFTHLSKFTGHDGYVTTLDVSSANCALVTGSSDSCVSVWDVETQLSKKQYPAHHRSVTAVSIKADDSNIFLSSSLDGSSLIWDIREDKPASCLTEENVGITGVQWIDEHYAVVCDLAGCVKVVDTRNKRDSIGSIRLLSVNHPLQRLRVCRERHLVAVTSVAPKLYVLSSEGGILESVYESDEHSELIGGLSWSKLTGRLHSCGWDTKVLHHTIPASLV